MHFIRKRLSTEKNKTLKEETKPKNVPEVSVAQDSKAKNVTNTAVPRSGLSVSKDSRSPNVRISLNYLLCTT